MQSLNKKYIAPLAIIAVIASGLNTFAVAQVAPQVVPAAQAQKETITPSNQKAARPESGPIKNAELATSKPSAIHQLQIIGQHPAVPKQQVFSQQVPAISQPPVPAINQKNSTPAVGELILPELHKTLAFKKPISAKQLMTKAERMEYRRAIKSVQTPEARWLIREITYARLRQRAWEQGMAIVDLGFEELDYAGTIMPTLQPILANHTSNGFLLFI